MLNEELRKAVEQVFGEVVQLSRETNREGQVRRRRAKTTKQDSHHKCRGEAAKNVWRSTAEQGYTLTR